jgi:hypothetical protein
LVVGCREEKGLRWGDSLDVVATTLQFTAFLLHLRIKNGSPFAGLSLNLSPGFVEAKIYRGKGIERDVDCHTVA